jgi:hypothetical protein
LPSAEVVSANTFFETTKSWMQPPPSRVRRSRIWGQGLRKETQLTPGFFWAKRNVRTAMPLLFTYENMKNKRALPLKGILEIVLKFVSIELISADHRTE